MEIQMDKLMELGSRLKEQRRSLGLEREEVAIKIKVSAKTLHALEEGIADSLPQPIFAKGFARSYAEAIGLKIDEVSPLVAEAFPSELINNINPELSAAAREESITINQPSNTRVIMLLGAVAIVVIGVVGWLFYRSFAPGIRDAMRTPPAVTQQTAPVASPDPGLAEEVAEPQPERAAELPLAAQETPLEASQSAAARPEARAAALLSGQVQQSNARANTPIPAGMKRVSLFAKYECWIGAEFDETGRRSFTLEAGQTFVLDFRDKLILTLGNAGAIDMSYNGQPYDTGGRFKEAKVLHFPPR